MKATIHTAAVIAILVLMAALPAAGGESAERLTMRAKHEITVNEDELRLEYNSKGEAFEEGDEIEAVLKAPSGGKAELLAGDDIRAEMTDTGENEYRCTYRIRHGDRLNKGTLSARLDYAGRSYKTSAAEPITISAYFFKVRIIAPENDSETDLYFDIIGRTRPNVTVFVVPAASIGGMNPFESSTKSSLGSIPGAIETRSDEKGYFKLHYGFPIKIPVITTKFKFYVNAMDDEGKRSLTTSFTTTMKKKMKK